MLDLKTVHGLFNFSVLLLLTRQGWSGWRIRRSLCLYPLQIHLGLRILL